MKIEPKLNDRTMLKINIIKKKDGSSLLFTIEIQESMRT